MESDAGIKGMPTYELVPTLGGPLAMVVDGVLLIADQGLPEANDQIALLASAAQTQSP
jgi:hypothetical protein